ncbi:DNA breaking-rejoining enzyme [Pisolithus albus]|nr:DNA breaking-rejoining enzyme [Pisolithus albus]
MLQSLDPNTRSNYGAGLLRFTQFCDDMSIAESERMPASSELLSMFAAHYAGKLSQKTLNNWLAALHFWHIVNGAPWHGNDMLRHLVPPSSKRAKRPPVTLEALCILHDRLDLSNTFDASVWALASLAFWSCCRLGELLIAPPQAFDPSKHVSRQVLPLSISTLENGTRHSTFHIPWPSKTTLSLGADISITARNNRTCPLAALLNHSSGSTGLPSHAPLFAYRTGNAGFPDMPGHAFRIGGATELLLQGVPPDVVATQGRWKSQAFLEYWRQISSILPLFISSSADSSRLLSLDTIMDNFARRTNACTVSSHV